MPYSKRITIGDVAAVAKVSPTAVSFAFNKPDQLGIDTVNRIRQVAADLGYMPSPVARALISKRVGSIGLLTPQPLSTVLANTYFLTFLQGMSSMCDEQEFGLLALSPIDGSLDRVFSRSSVDGFVISGFDEDHREVLPLKKRRIPFVVVDGAASSVSSVNVDDEAGAYASAHHMLSNGHRDILILMIEGAFGHHDEGGHGVGRRRLAGYHKAFVEHGADWRDEWVLPAASSRSGGEREFNVALAQGMRPTAVLCAADATAVGVITAAHQHGLSVPRDVEIIGFDDSIESNLVRPALSTVHQPIFEKGRSAVRLLTRHIDGDERAEHIVMETRLLLRDTTRTRAG